MDWVAIGAIIEMVGTIAVVVALNYVGMQIKQSTKRHSSCLINASREPFGRFRTRPKDVLA